MAEISQYPRQSSQREANRTAAIDAGRDLFYEFGYGGTSLAMIAERAGISTATLFKHFPTKAQVLVAVVEREWSAAEIEPRVGGDGNHSVVVVGDGLTLIGEAFVSFLRRPGTTELFRLIIAEAPNVAELAQLGSFADGPHYALAREFLAHVSLPHSVSASERDAAARRFIGIIAGQILWTSLMDPTRVPSPSRDGEVIAAARSATLHNLGL